MTEPIVQVQQGKLQGKISVDSKGNNFYSFQGIPYGKPPIGDLRFKAPIPAESWTGIRDATVEGPESISRHMIYFHNVGSEDCLSLNVYTPQLPNNGPLKPVMVWIHGGGFTAGSSKTEIYGPEFLITQDIVLVSINYRLGILGFLSLEDTTLGVPGNAGLKDMVLALHWVQKNIKQFNGDPNNVTIFGESAGSGACHFLMLSPSAKGLFHRAILQSGVCINAWATGSRNAIQIAQVLGSPAKTEQEALEFLRNVSSDQFITAQDIMKDGVTIDEVRPFSPVIEKPNPEAFITKHPIDIMLSGDYNKVPIIIGYTSREGMLFELTQKLIGNKNVVYRLPNFERAIPAHYNIKKGTELSKSIAKKIEAFYYGAPGSPEDDIDKFYIINSDLFFIRGIQVSIRSMLKTLNQPIYFYRFNVETALNLYKKIGNITVPGVSHADDLGYLFKTLLTPEIEPGSVEEIAMQRVLKLWTNFAKTGNPNPKTKDALIDVVWPPVTTDAFKCLDIDKQLAISINPEEERMKFWDNISATNGINSKL